DQKAASATLNCSITLNTPVAALAISTAALAPVSTGVAVMQQLSASGGVAPYLWSLRSGTLPPGLLLSPSGSISGSPTTVGSYSFTVRVSDSAAVFAERTFTLDAAA